MIPLFKVLINPSAKEAVAKVLESNFTGEGQVCKDFENEFQKLVEAKEKPLLVNSCTNALDLAYHLTLKRGDTVISSPLSCLATHMSLLHRGINILWADVFSEDGLIDYNDVHIKFNKDVKAIIGVDWCGKPADYYQLKSFGVPVIQDAAHSVLATYQGLPIAQNGGDFVAWSFQSIKHLSMGDGGALLVPPQYYEEAKKLRWFYLDRDKSPDLRCAQDTERAGFKYQSNNVSAAIGLENMKLTKWAVKQHRENARFLYTCLRNMDGISVPEWDEGSSHWMFGLTVDKMDRDLLIQKLGECGVMASEAHRRNDLQTCFKEYRRNDLPGLQYFSDRQLNIPCGWWLKNQDLEIIVDSMKKILA